MFQLPFVFWQMYWPLILNELSIQFYEPPKCVVDTSDKHKHGGTWLPGAVLNVADCCLQPSTHMNKYDNNVAIMWRNEGCEDCDVEHLTLKELREQVMYALNPSCAQL